MSAIHTPTFTNSSLPGNVSNQRGYYNISQAAALLGVSRVSIWRWIRAGQLPALRLGHRTTRIKHEDLERILQRGGPASARSGAISGAALGVYGVETEERSGGDAGSAGAPRFDWRAVGERGGEAEHFVQFYDSDAFLLDAVSDFISTAIRTGDAGLVIATPAHRAGIEERLQAEGLDFAAAAAAGRYVALDAAETLSQFMVDGKPEPGRFQETLGGVISRAADGGRHVRAFGEMVALLVDEENPVAAVELEALWNELQQTHPFVLFCAYPMAHLGGEALAAVLDDVCAAHSRVIPAESYSALADPHDRLRAIAALQQKAQSLQAEIAARKQVEQRLQAALAAERAAREEAEAALRVRSEFLSIAAHELKTPLTGLSGYAQLLQRRLNREGHLSPDLVEQALAAITGQAGKLSRLLSQLLDLSRLEAGKLTLERQTTDLAALVEQVICNARAWSDRHTITLGVPPSLQPLALPVDPLRLEQVLVNLLDNAVKYSPAGGPIEVTLALRPAPGTETQRGGDAETTLPASPRPGISATDGGGAEGTWVELAVRDRGVGIPPEKRGDIFERFYQAHGNGHKSGLGLGLFISRQIVELHGGEIHAEFPPDGGTRFVVRLLASRLPGEVDSANAQAGALAETLPD